MTVYRESYKPNDTEEFSFELRAKEPEVQAAFQVLQNEAHDSLVSDELTDTWATTETDRPVDCILLETASYLPDRLTDGVDCSERQALLGVIPPSCHSVRFSPAGNRFFELVHPINFGEALPQAELAETLKALPFVKDAWPVELVITEDTVE